MANWLDAIGKQEETFDPKLSKQTQAKQAAAQAEYGKKVFGIPVATPKVGTVASNYGAGAAGSVMGKAVPKPSEVKISKPAAPKASTGASGGAAKAPASLSSILNVDPTGMFKPALDFLETQRKFAQSRYESNAANLKNIFGALTGLAAADQAKIKEQYIQSLAASQTAQAQRFAAENAATAQGVAQAEATGAERGMGPGMAVNPIQAAQAEGQAQAGAAQTVWEGLMRANEAQQMQDTRNRQAGYGYQEVAANQALMDSLNERLMGLEESKAGVLGDVAQAKFGVAQNVAQARYQEAVAARNAAASAAAAKAAAAANVPAADRLRNQLGPQRFNALTNQMNTAYTRAYNAKNPVDPVTGKMNKVQMPNASDVLSAWIAGGGNRDLVNEAKTLSSLLYNK